MLALLLRMVRMDSYCVLGLSIKTDHILSVHLCTVYCTIIHLNCKLMSLSSITKNTSVLSPGYFAWIKNIPSKSSKSENTMTAIILCRCECLVLSTEIRVLAFRASALRQSEWANDFPWRRANAWDVSTRIPLRWPNLCVVDCEHSLFHASTRDDYEHRCGRLQGLKDLVLTFHLD